MNIFLAIRTSTRLTQENRHPNIEHITMPTETWYLNIDNKQGRIVPT